jgi:hypothetical protein
MTWQKPYVISTSVNGQISAYPVNYPMLAVHQPPLHDFLKKSSFSPQFIAVVSNEHIESLLHNLVVGAGVSRVLAPMILWPELAQKQEVFVVCLVSGSSALITISRGRPNLCCLSERAQIARQ